MEWFKCFSETERKKQRLEQAFAGREPLDEHALWERCFKAHGVLPATVARVRRVLSEVLQADLSRIRDTDDFSGNLRFFWDLDSLADVEVVAALEKEFDVSISDEAATSMRTFKDIVLSIHDKL